MGSPPKRAPQNPYFASCVVLLFTAMFTLVGLFTQDAIASALSGSATTLESVTSAGETFAYGGTSPSISADGRFIAFESDGPVAGGSNPNGGDSVYLRDAQTGITTLESVTSAGETFTYGGTNPVVSADGRFIAFESPGPEPGGSNPNGSDSIYLRDTLTGITTLESVTSAGETFTYGGTSPSISSDGRFIAFESDGPVAGGSNPNGGDSVYLRDTQTGITTLESVTSAGETFTYGDTSPSISADGRFIAFESDGPVAGGSNPNGTDTIYLRDTLTGTTTLESVTSAGETFTYGGTNPVVSADGRFIAFESPGPEPGGSNPNGSDSIYLRDTLTGITTLESVTSAGETFTYGGTSPSISADGRFIAFESDGPVAGGSNPNGGDRVCIGESQTGITTLESVTSAGETFTYGGTSPSISADGRFI